MNIFDRNMPLILDGGLGTMLHARGLSPGERPETWNLTRPEVLTEIHRAYLDAGAQVIATNTFGANRLNYPDNLREVIFAAVANARAAVGAGDALVALDVGPTGKLLAPMGDLALEEAIALFRKIGELGAAAGADLFFIETMTDLAELRAAVLGLKEAAGLPIFASFSVEESGRLMTGAPAVTAAVMLEGLGVAALGVNCGAGPERAAQVLPEICAATKLPVIAQPNAGLPVVRGGVTCFELSPEDFAQGQLANLRAGAAILGGCCGTTPAHIQAMAQAVASLSPLPPDPSRLIPICGCRDVMRLPAEIAEIDAQDWDDIVDEVLDLDDALVACLNIDHMETPGEAVAYIQQQVWRPLCFAGSDSAKLEAALRAYTGRALVDYHGTDDIKALIKYYGGELL